MFVDYNKLTAVTDGDYTIGSYIDYYTDFNLADLQTVYGEPVPMELKYDEKPSFSFTAGSWYPSKIENSWFSGSTLSNVSSIVILSKMPGLLFIKSSTFKKSGSGWNSNCDLWLDFKTITPWKMEHCRGIYRKANISDILHSPT